MNLEDLSRAIVEGDSDKSQELTGKPLEEGRAAREILYRATYNCLLPLPPS